jgi:hypothetical protein
MNTEYSEVLELVLALMKSYGIDTIYNNSGENGIINFFIPYIKVASGELENNNNSIIDLSKRNDVLYEFNEKLTDGKQLIIAKYILIGYLSSETYDILQMKLHLQDGDFKTYAEKNNLDGKLNALYMLKEEVGYDLKRKGYNTFTW